MRIVGQPSEHLLVIRCECLRSLGSVEESLAAFNRHVRPMEQVQRTRQKYLTHRLTILTWAIWKGVLPDLIPMSDDLLLAFTWDALAFEASLPVLRQCVNAILAWHQRLRLAGPLGGQRDRDYKRLMHSLASPEKPMAAAAAPLQWGVTVSYLHHFRA